MTIIDNVDGRDDEREKKMNRKKYQHAGTQNG